jgi:stage II sporulation protein AA (anti-sigma F factor antagonist)
VKNIHFDIADDILIANLWGEVDHHNASIIRSEIDSAMKAFHTKNLVLDYSHVSFMDSSGIGLAMGRYNSVRSMNGTLVIIPGSQYVSRILGLSGIFGIVPKSKSVRLAVEYINEKGGKKFEH